MSNTNESINRLMEQYKDIASEYYRLSTRDILSETEAKKLEHILEAASDNEELSLLLNEIDESIFQEDDFFSPENLSNYQNERSRALELTGDNILPRQTIFKNSKLNLETYKNTVEEYHRLANLEYLSELDERRMEKMLEQLHQDELLLFLSNVIDNTAFEASTIRQDELQEYLQQVEKARQKLAKVRENFEHTNQPTALPISKTTGRNNKKTRWIISSRLIAACVLTALTIPCIRYLGTKPESSTARSSHQDSVEEPYENSENPNVSLEDIRDTSEGVQAPIAEPSQPPVIHEPSNSNRAFEPYVKQEFNMDSASQPEEMMEFDVDSPQIPPSLIQEWQHKTHEQLTTQPMMFNSDDSSSPLNHSPHQDELESSKDEEKLRLSHPQSPLEQNEEESNIEENTPLFNDGLIDLITTSNEAQIIEETMFPRDEIHDTNNSEKEENIDFNHGQIAYPGPRGLVQSLDLFRINPLEGEYQDNGIETSISTSGGRESNTGTISITHGGGTSGATPFFVSGGNSNGQITSGTIANSHEEVSIHRSLQEYQILHFATHGDFELNHLAEGDRDRPLLLNVPLSVESPTNGGTILISGDFQEQEPVSNASQILVHGQSSLSGKRPENNDGSWVTVWSGGDIHVMERHIAGDGGFVEVSGELLLEPENILISQENILITDDDMGANAISLSINSETDTDGEANTLGGGNQFNLNYTHPKGIDGQDLHYRLPMMARNGLISFSYRSSHNEVIEESVTELDITSDSRYYETSFRQPLIETPVEEFALSLTASRRESEGQFLEVQPIPRTSVDADSHTRISSLRLGQDWIKRGEGEVLALASEFSVGLDALGSRYLQESYSTNDITALSDLSISRVSVADDLGLDRTQGAAISPNLLREEQIVSLENLISTENNDESLYVEKFTVNGNTVFSENELAAITEEFEQRELSFPDLLEVSSAITNLYLKEGYITSRAFIQSETIENGIVNIQVIEGTVAQVDITEDGSINSDYIRETLRFIQADPLNIVHLEERIGLLETDPRVDHISAKILPGENPGSNILAIEINAETNYRNLSGRGDLIIIPTQTANSQRQNTLPLDQECRIASNVEFFNIGSGGSLPSPSHDSLFDLIIAPFITLNIDTDITEQFTVEQNQIINDQEQFVLEEYNQSACEF